MKVARLQYFILIFGWFSINQYVIQCEMNLVEIIQLAELATQFAGKSETPDLCGMNSSQLISYYNYIPEVHTVTTEKGYILTVVRCNSKKQCNDNKKVAILVHGLFGSSDDYVLNPPDQALAYVLADAGYDVWIPNTRGNCYSRNHEYLDPDAEFGEFWKFSWDDAAFQDFPCVFNYIGSITNQKKYYFVGNSQGTSQMLAFLAEFPKWNDRFHAVSLIAPVAFVSNPKFLWVAGRTLSTFLNREGGVEILPRSNFSKKLGSLCKGVGADICRGIIRLAWGKDSDEDIDKSMLEDYFCIFPSGSSVFQLLHFGEEITGNYFGPRKNATGLTPNNYRVERITAPLSFHYSTSDLIASTADLDKLLPMLTGQRSRHIHVQKVDDFNHVDFAISSRAAKLIYSNILHFFKKHGS